MYDLIGDIHRYVSEFRALPTKMDCLKEGGT